MTDSNLQLNDSRSMYKEILKIGIPSILETLFTTFSSIINSRMVSSMGIAAISAISVTNQPRLFVLSIFFAINTVVSSLVARNLGKRDRLTANRIFIVALTGTIVLGLIVSFACIFFAKPIMVVCSGQKDTMDDSILYFKIVMGGIIFNLVFMVINAAFRGCGKTGLTFSSNVISCLVNIGLNYVLIEGRFGAPALGIKGAGIATVAGTVVACIVSVAFVFKEGSFISLSYDIKDRVQARYQDSDEFVRMWKRVLVENILTRVGFLITSIIVARIGSFEMSVYSVGMNLMNINFALGSGLQTSSVALIGRSLGEGAPEKIKQYSGKILKAGIISAIGLSVLFVIFAKPYYSFFAKDEAEFISVGIKCCYIIAAVSPIQTCQIIYNGLLQGIGDMKFTMIAAVISVTIVNTLATFLFTIVLGLGIWGVWIGVFCSQLTRVVMLRSRWSKEDVLKL